MFQPLNHIYCKNIVNLFINDLSIYDISLYSFSFKCVPLEATLTGPFSLFTVSVKGQFEVPDLTQKVTEISTYFIEHPSHSIPTLAPPTRYSHVTILS